jgi:lysine-specific permease
LNSGTTIATAGPGGAILAFVLIGLWLVFVCQAIGEIATLLPLPGAFNAWGARIFDEAFSFMMTWMYFFNWALTIPAELSASATVVAYWLPQDADGNVTGHFKTWIVPILIILLMIAVNMLGVKAYGELEYWFSILKVVTVIMFIIVGILVDAGAVGGVTYGVKAWSSSNYNHGFTTFTAFMSTLVSVGFSYGGTELTGVTAAESRHPHKHVPKAVNTVMVRIAFFYIVSIFLLSSIIDDTSILINQKQTATAAPMTIVLAKAGMKGAANYMNAVIFTSVVSATNSDFYVSTRMLLSLARNGWAPKIVGKTNARGVPYVALTIVVLFSFISLLTIFIGSGVVFNWLVSLIGSIIFQAWIFILFLHFRFRQCWKAQGRPVSDLPYVSWGYPYGNYLATLIGVCCILANLYTSVAVGKPSDGGTVSGYAQNLLGAWFPWLLAGCLYFGYKFAKGTKFVRPEEADLDTGRFIPSESDKLEMATPRVWWKRLFENLI